MLPEKLVQEYKAVERATSWILQTFSSSENILAHIEDIFNSNLSESKTTQLIRSPYRRIKSWYTSDLYKKWSSDSDLTDIEYLKTVLHATLFLLSDVVIKHQNEFLKSSDKKLFIVNTILENHIQLYQTFERPFKNAGAEDNKKVIVGMKLILPKQPDKEKISKIKTFCSALVKLNLINKKTENPCFWFFRGTVINHKIDWQSYAYILRYVMIRLKENGAFINNDKTRIWPRVAECFTIKGEPINKPELIRTNDKEISDATLKSDINKAIDTLVYI